MAAFWLGAKLEEVVRIDEPSRLTLRHVLMMFTRVARRREGRSLEVLSPWSQVRGWEAVRGADRVGVGR